MRYSDSLQPQGQRASVVTVGEFQTPTAVSTDTLFITIVAPVRNEAGSIRRVLDQLLGQDYDPARFEIIVVDGQSTDETRAIVTDEYLARYENVTLLSNPKLWSSAARNLGVRHARGDVVLIVDGHCEVTDDQLLRNLANAFTTSGADCVGRPQPLDVSEATAFQRAVAAARSSRLGHHPSSFVYSNRAGFVPALSVAVAYRREVFDNIGFFDERFDACEDVDFNRRADLAGLDCYFAPDVAVRYQPRKRLSGLFYQLMRYGQGRGRLFRKAPSTFSLKTATPSLFVLGCCLGPLLCWLLPWLTPAYVAALAVYVGVVLLVSVALSGRQRDAAILPWLPLVFAAIHMGAGLGMLYELTVGMAKARFRRGLVAARVP